MLSSGTRVIVKADSDPDRLFNGLTGVLTRYSKNGYAVIRLDEQQPDPLPKDTTGRQVLFIHPEGVAPLEA